jgi:signal transduction histidine kinase/CheY-like chemotaxis protein
MKRLFYKESWSYAVLLIILFTIGAIAVFQTLSYVEGQVSHESFTVVAVVIWTLTMGFMLIAGAFGLWTIQFAAKAEGRRRVGRFVDAMDYLRDGLITVDGKGRITGSNPTVRSLAASNLSKQESIREVFPCLSDEDIGQLLNTREPTEVERQFVRDGTPRLLRFRSQPSEDLTLVLVSDVTSMNAQRQHSRHLARLQLIGQLARGVANDFNNLLCSISGHASLLTRVQPGSPDMFRSVTAVTREAEKGIAMAGHLLELARPSAGGRYVRDVSEHVHAAATSLRDSLAEGWAVECSGGDLPPVGLTGIQLEQAIFNLGLLVADAYGEPATLRIDVSKPDASYLLNVGDAYAGVILIRGASGKGDSVPQIPRTASRETGVIQSVIQSIIEESGGKLDGLTGMEGGPLYRIALPYGDVLGGEEDIANLPSELGPYIAHWSILMAAAGDTQRVLQKRLEEFGAKVDRVGAIVAALARVEESGKLDAIVLDRSILGHECSALLRALLKLRPSAGVVVLGEPPEVDGPSLTSDVVFVSPAAGPSKIIFAMVTAKSLAARRKPPA